MPKVELTESELENITATRERKAKRVAGGPEFEAELAGRDAEARRQKRQRQQDRLAARKRIVEHRQAKRSDTCPMCNRDYDGTEQLPGQRLAAAEPPAEQLQQVVGFEESRPWILVFADSTEEQVMATDLVSAIRQGSKPVVRARLLDEIVSETDATTSEETEPVSESSPTPET